MTSLGDIGPHEGQVGFVFELIVTDVVIDPVTEVQTETVLNISTATTKEIILRMEGGARVVKTATFSTNGSDGKIRCVSAAGDIGKGESVYVEGHVILLAEEFYTETLVIPVSAHL